MRLTVSQKTWLIRQAFAWGVVAGSCAVIGWVAPSSVWAQHAGPAGKGKAKAGGGSAHGSAGPGRPSAGPGRGGSPGGGHGSMPAGMGSSPGMSGPGGKTMTGPIPGSTPDNEVFVQPDPEKLPADFVPPQDPPELMTLEKPIATADELKSLRNDIGKYGSLLRAGEIKNDDDRKLLARGVRYRLAQLTLKENRGRLHSFREELSVRDSQSAGRLLNKADAVRAFRTTFCEEIVKQAVPLLDNNFHVRLQVVALLGELDVTTADPKLNLQTVAYAKAAQPLMDFLKATDQPESIKPVAVRGLYRILKIGQADTPLRTEITQVLVDELAKKDTHFWYQMRLCEALSASDITLDRRDRKPFVLTRLKSVLEDESRHWLVRSEAAHALGRVPFDPSVPAQPIVQSIGALGLQMTRAMVKDPAQHYWRRCFVKVYLAFQPLDETDKDATKKVSGGLLSQPAAMSPAREVYAQLLPVIRTVVNREKVTADQLKTLEAAVDKAAPTTAKAGDSNVSATTPPQTPARN